MFQSSIDNDSFLNSNHFYNSKVINIKLLNGDIFPIEINYFDDDENKIINKICSYDNKYRFRKHRLKIFNEDEKSIKEILKNIKDNDTLYVYSESPPDKYCTKYSYKDDRIDMFNYFYIKEKEDYYDTIDRLFFEIYDKNLPSLFFIDKNFYNLGYVQMYIDILIKTIFEKEDITRIFFNSNSTRDMTTFFINCIVKYYRDLDTIGLDLNYTYNPLFSSLTSVLDKLFNKISNTKNIYINLHLLKATSSQINFLNSENVYIYSSSIERIIKSDLYTIFKKIKSFNNINIKHNYIEIDTYNEGWVNIGLKNNYYIYRHISTLDNNQLFNNYDLYEDCTKNNINKIT